jgi:hypothetical protein
MARVEVRVGGYCDMQNLQFSFRLKILCTPYLSDLDGLGRL